MTISHEDRSIRLVHNSRSDGAPTKVWVARSWGLPVPFLLFPEELVTVALSGYSEHIHEGLSIISPPSAVQRLLPTFADGTNTPGISAPGEPGLSSTHVNMSRDYSPFHVCYRLRKSI
ncbi:hypothetical protein QFZ31_001569 [Neobacillus niacini]|nr:hypothetical protein [Neobacillus niacini]